MFVLYSEDTGYGTEAITQDGVFAYVYVKISPTVKTGFTEIVIKNSGVDENPFKPVPIVKHNGGVNVDNYGDINGDGDVNSTDLTLMNRYILDIIEDFPYEEGFRYADINRDGDINSTDLSLLKRIILKMFR